jgi:hypothetical protein
VHYAGIMGSSDRGSHRQHPIGHLFHGERTDSGESPPKVLALKQLHHKERPPTLGSNVENGHDVRMLYRRRGSAFANNASNRTRVRCGVGTHELHRNARAKDHVPPFPYFPHGSAAKRSQDLVRTELPGNRK